KKEAERATNEAQRAKADAQAARESEAAAKRKLADAEAARTAAEACQAPPKANQDLARGCEGGSCSTTHSPLPHAETFADVRALVEKHLPAEVPVQITQRQLAGVLDTMIRSAARKRSRLLSAGASERPMAAPVRRPARFAVVESERQRCSA